MVGHGTPKPVFILVSNTYVIHRLKGIVERTIEYLKDRTEAYKWLTLFTFMHNTVANQILNSMIQESGNISKLTWPVDYGK